MIARLSGILVECEFTRCIVDVQGVGYELAIPLSTFDRMPQVGEPVVLLVLTQVREDAITLFGFATAEEKRLFELLLTVSGVGGKLALNVLSCMPVATFAAAVVAGDVKALSRISGVGKRTAERLALELRDKVSNIALAEGTAMPGALRSGSSFSDGTMEAMRDAALALEQLGFKSEAVNKVLCELVSGMEEKDITSEKLLRQGILALNGR